jgi:uncharacterized protein YdiU (UPF0061 family)
VTETENWILNEFANDLVEAIKTQSDAVIAECQKEYDDYLEILRQRIAERGKAA